MIFSMSQSLVETMPSGTWNDFTDLPAEFLSELGADIHDTPQRRCFYSNSFVYFASAMDDFLITSCLISTIFNFVVISCSMKLFKERGDTLHLFILNMTVGDTLLTLFCHPYELLARRHTSVQVHSITVFLNFANWVGLAVSGLSLTLLNVDKLIFFCWPFKYDTWMSCFRAKLFCCLTWFISIAFATYYWVYSYLYFMNKNIDLNKRLRIQYVFLTLFMNGDRLSPINKFFYEAFTVIFCVIPIVSSLFVSCYLYDLTKRKRKLTLCTAPNGKSENKATSFAFIFATTLWTSCSLLPYRLTNLARIHVIAWPNLECESKRNLSWFTWSMLYLLILNPIVNPFITAFAYAPYRQYSYSMFTKTSVSTDFTDRKRTMKRSGKKEKKTKSSEMKSVFYIKLPSDIMNHESKTEYASREITKKAPLANLPSICSCGSLLTPDSINCTRF